MLKKTFIDLLANYTSDVNQVETLWREIEKHYSNKDRYYHTLIHLENMLEQLTLVKDKIHQWHTILFSLFYHDIVYNALKSNNEEKSAAVAVKRMTAIGIPDAIIDNCNTQILATKSHLLSTDSDTNYLLDADLSILGQSWEIYTDYFQNVRKEYSIYPDFLYNKGRKKVLKHFIEMPRIYKTDFFHEQFERKAKTNLATELASL